MLKSLVPSNYTSDTIIVSNPAFFGNLSALLDKTPKETIQSYFSWRLTVSRLTSVEAPEVQPYLRFSRKLNGRVSGSLHEPPSQDANLGGGLDPDVFADLVLISPISGRECCTG